MYSIFRNLALILISAKFFALLARKCRAPQVVGEIIAGLVIGPCLLNLVQPSDSIAIFAEIGVVLLMFTTGLGTNLQELGKLKSFLGTTIVSAAVIDDVIGIVVLTCVLGASGGTDTSLVDVLMDTVLFFIAAIVIGLIIHKAMLWLDHRNPHTQRITIVSLAFCFAMAYIAEQYFGIADITGAYIAGIVLCSLEDASYIERRVDISSYTLFAPVFFASIGLKTDISGLTPTILLFSACFVGVALLPKIIGCGLAAKACRFNWSDSLKVGVGMMTRGEVALIVAQKGLGVGVVDPVYFTAVILLIVVSSIVTPLALKGLFAKA